MEHGNMEYGGKYVWEMGTMNGVHILFRFLYTFRELGFTFGAGKKGWGLGRGGYSV